MLRFIELDPLLIRIILRNIQIQLHIFSVNFVDVFLLSVKTENGITEMGKLKSTQSRIKNHSLEVIGRN